MVVVAVVINHLIVIVETSPLALRLPLRELRGQVGTRGTQLFPVQSATELIWDVKTAIVAPAEESWACKVCTVVLCKRCSRVE